MSLYIDGLIHYCPVAKRKLFLDPNIYERCPQCYEDLSKIKSEKYMVCLP